jgi:hypothetical protein
VGKKCKFPEIRAELRQREQESRAIRKQINESSGMARWAFWEEKRNYGGATRDLLLAYAFLRGMPYRVCEPKTSEDYSRFAPAIQCCLSAHGHEFEKEAIKAWFETEASKSAQEAA